MKLHQFNLQPFSKVEDLVAASTVGSKESSLDDLIDKLGSDDSKVTDDVPETIELEPENKEEVDEKKVKSEDKEEIDLEEEEPKIKDEDIVTPIRRKEIAAKYPTLFKEFPYLDQAMYREQEYTKLFPSIGEAKEARENLEQFDNFRNQVLSGNLDVVLSSLKDANPKSYAKVVNNYLPILAKADKDAYLHVTSGVIKDVIKSMASEARGLAGSESTKQSGDNLLTAARILNQFIFRSSNVQEDKPFGGEDAKENPEEIKLSEERQQFLNERFQVAFSDIQTNVDNVLMNTIKANIDPKDSMSSYVKDKAVDDAFDELEEMLKGDERFGMLMGNLWKKAAASNFDQESQKAIKRAYLEKSKTLLKTVIQNSRNAALKGMGKRITETREEPVNKGPVTQGRAATSQSSRKEGLQKGESYEDFLMR